MSSIPLTDSTDGDPLTLRFVRRVSILLLGASLLMLALEALEVAGVLSDPVQGGVSFAVSLAVAFTIASGCRSLPASSRLHPVIYLLLFTGALYMLISWTEDLEWFDRVPILGRNDSRFRKMTKVSSLACWFTASPLMAWNMLAVHRRLTAKLEQRITQRTQRLSESNERLQAEIRQHIATGNELKAAQTKIESLAEKRSQQLAVAEQELVRHERLKALGKMASGIAHELNNTLAPICAYVDLLRASPGLSREQQAWLEDVARAADDATHVVHSLQQFHGKGKSRASHEPVNAVEIVQQVLELTRPVWKDAAEAEGKQVQVVAQLESTSTVLANAGELRQVLTNLILNSLDAISSKGRIRVELKDDASSVEFRIVDDGCGMNATELVTCMEPFYTTKADGAGLGLSVSCGLIQNHGSRLMVQSVPNEETVFSFKLPIVRDDKESAPVPSPLNGMSAKLSIIRALYVDDNPAVMHSFCRLLSSLSVETVTACGGEQALEVAQTCGELDVVIVDMGMPGMNGAETITALTHAGLHCPSIVVSGWPKDSVIDRFEQLPPDFVLTKPVQLAELSRVLNEVRLLIGRK